MILVLRADSPDVEIGLFDKSEELEVKKWQAGRELSQQILNVIEDLLNERNLKKSDLTGIVIYEGPGSYTGLRISISVANAIGYSHDIPVIGTTGDSWVTSGIEKLKDISNFVPVNPVYGGEVYTTKPKK